jgi:hypothetical protein
MVERTYMYIRKEIVEGADLSTGAAGMKNWQSARNSLRYSTTAVQTYLFSIPELIFFLEFLPKNLLEEGEKR